MRRLTPLLGFALLLGAFTPTGDAYRVSGRWYSKTVTYYNQAGAYRVEVARAAHAWNASGAKIRWLPARRARARVIITVDPAEGGGRATTPPPGGKLLRGRIYLAPDLLRREDGEGDRLPLAILRAEAAAVVAHEMGHVMGLLHENRGCALMNTAFFSHCQREWPNQPWRYRCRILEPDDVRGVVRIYGGRARPLPPPDCALVEQPPPVTDVRIVANPEYYGFPLVSWTTPNDGAVHAVRVMSQVGGGCPPADGVSRGNWGSDDVPPARGRRQQYQNVTAPLDEPAHFCFRVATIGAFERVSTSTAIEFEYSPQA